MDWTRIPRSLIYEERKRLEDLNVETEGTLEETFFKKLIKRPLIMRLDDPYESVINVFNNARYLCTLILLEKHPYLFRHVYYKLGVKDHEGETLWEYHLYPATMALVCNYLCNNLGYIDKDDIVKHYLDHLQEWGKVSPEGQDDFYTLLLLEGNPFLNPLGKNSFAPRIITHNALKQAFYSGKQTWRNFTHDYDMNTINDIFSCLGKTNEEKEDMRQSLRLDVDTFCDQERKPRVLAQIDALSFSSAQEIANTGMEARYSRLLFEKQLLSKELEELKVKLKEAEVEKQHAKDMLPSSDYHDHMREELETVKSELEALKNTQKLFEKSDFESQEFIIFFSNLLGVDLSPESINQSALAYFLQEMSGRKGISQSTISRLNKKEKDKKFSTKDKKDASHLLQLLMNIPRDVKNKRPEVIYKLIEGIFTVYDMSGTDLRDLTPEKKDQFRYLFKK